MNRNVFHAKGKDRDNFKPGNMKNSQWNSMLLASLFCQLIDNFVSMYAGMCRYPLNYSCCSWCQVAYTRICTRLCKVLCLWFPDCSTDNESVTVRSTLIAVLTMSLWGAHWLQYWQWVCEEHTDCSTDNEYVRSTLIAVLTMSLWGAQPSLVLVLSPAAWLSLWQWWVLVPLSDL